MPNQTGNRIQQAITLINERLATLEPEKISLLELNIRNDPMEHFAYQEEQARAHASGTLSTEEAQIIYRALGEVPGEDGWAAGTDLATKIVVTQVLAELMTARLGRR